eukprot:6013333-Amphidinium_carterae.1
MVHTGASLITSVPQHSQAPKRPEMAKTDQHLQRDSVLLTFKAEAGSMVLGRLVFLAGLEPSCLTLMVRTMNNFNQRPTSYLLGRGKRA